MLLNSVYPDSTFLLQIALSCSRLGEKTAVFYFYGAKIMAIVVTEWMQGELAGRDGMS